MFIRCFYGLQGVLRFLSRSDYRINTNLCADKKYIFFFFRQKNTTNEANWSEVNRNGLHSLEESLI